VIKLIVSLLKGVTLALGAVFGLLLFVAMLSPDKPSAPTGTRTIATATITPEPDKRIGWLQVNARYQRDGSVLQAFDLKVRNDNPDAARDFAIECRCFGASGTLIGAVRHTVYVRVPGKRTSQAQKPFTVGFIPAQTDRLSCDIIAAVFE
jgi:hypothetical protein